MAHHSSEIPDEIKDLFGMKEDERLKQLRNLMQTIPFGATNQFPQGKLNDADEGEIAFGVAADKKAGKVIINFGKPTAWIGMDREQALELADTLKRKADDLLALDVA